MTQEEKWHAKYDEVKAFIEKNKRNPSRYDDEERGMYCNWLKHQRKLYNSGEMKEERREMFEKLLPLFKELLERGEEVKRKNQYE